MTDTRIIIIGAGMAGIAMTVQLQRRLGCYDYEVYDKWQTPGGTWAQNTYPNLSCDVPSELRRRCDSAHLSVLLTRFDVVLLLLLLPKSRLD